MKSQTAEEFVRDFTALADSLFGDSFVEERLRICAPIILDGVADNFDKSQTAAGVRWPDRKDPGPTHPLLILDGDLKVAATYGNINRVVGDTLEVGVSKDTIPYAGVHQYGYPDRNIAQREYLAMSNATIDHCCQIVAAAAVAELVD